MKHNALILDLDNTIFPVKVYGEQLFGALFRLIASDGSQHNHFNNIKAEIMRRPFQSVAARYNFPEQLYQRCNDLLTLLVCNIALKPYNGYEWIRSLSCRKYLVTIGYHRFQHSKIEALGIAADFDEIVIADPNVSNKSKKEVFSDILVRSKYSPKEVLVVGDDYDSEIKTARELGIDAVLFNASGNFTGETDVPVVSGYNELLPLL